MKKTIFKSLISSFVFVVGVLVFGFLVLKVMAGITNVSSGSLLTADMWNDMVSQVFQKNGNNLYYMTGNVGIGINNPTNKLEVNGVLKTTYLSVINSSDAPYLQIKGTSDGYNYSALELRTNNGNNKRRSINHKSQAGNTNNFWIAYNNGSSWSYPFAITTGGNVGIGTTTPLAKLQVEGGLMLKSSNSLHRCLLQPYYNATPGLCPAGYTYLGGDSGISLCIDCNY